MGTRRVHVRLGQSPSGQVFKPGSAISSGAAEALTWPRQNEVARDSEDVGNLYTLRNYFFDEIFFILVSAT
jgi:hypothetical protein